MVFTDLLLGFDHGLGKTDKTVRTRKAKAVRKEIVDWMFREVFNKKD
jgi:hypothetical protein